MRHEQCQLNKVYAMYTYIFIAAGALQLHQIACKFCCWFSVEADTSRFGNDDVITEQQVYPFGTAVMLVVIPNDVEAAARGSTGGLEDKGIICFY